MSNVHSDYFVCANCGQHRHSHKLADYNGSTFQVCPHVVFVSVHDAKEANERPVSASAQRETDVRREGREVSDNGTGERHTNCT